MVRQLASCLMIRLKLVSVACLGHAGTYVTLDVGRILRKGANQHGIKTRAAASACAT